MFEISVPGGRLSADWEVVPSSEDHNWLCSNLKRLDSPKPIPRFRLLEIYA